MSKLSKLEGYKSRQIEDLYVPLRQRRDLETSRSWVRTSSKGRKLAVVLQRILQSKMPVPLQMRVNCVGLFCLGRPRLHRPSLPSPLDNPRQGTTRYLGLGRARRLVMCRTLRLLGAF